MPSGTTCWKTNTSTASCTSWSRSGQVQPSVVRRWVERSWRAARCSTSSRVAASECGGPATPRMTASRPAMAGPPRLGGEGRQPEGVDRTLDDLVLVPLPVRGEHVPELLPADDERDLPERRRELDRVLRVDVDDRA